MEGNRKHISELNHFCIMEIMSYIIADCKSIGKTHGMMKYANLVSFALASNHLEAVLREWKNNLYKDLEFVFVANRDSLKIDFGLLLTTHKGKAGDVFWRFFVDAIKENNKVENVTLNFAPKTFQSGFLDHFLMIKSALQNKRNLQILKIALKGYSLDDLNNFDHIIDLHLDVRMSAEALVSVCRSNPMLVTLEFMSTEIRGRLSDIVPHCPNLQKLKFSAKPDIDEAEYAPLAQIPTLREMTIHGAFENGSLLRMFEAIRKWHRLGPQSLIIKFIDELPLLSKITLPRKNLLLYFQAIKGESETSVKIIASYNFADLIKYLDPLEESHTTISLFEGVRFSVSKFIGRRLHVSRFKASNESALAFLVKVFNINFLDLYLYEESHLAKFLGSLYPEGLFALKTLQIFTKKLDPLETAELVKIQTIENFEAVFTDWQSFNHLSKLTHLQLVKITVEEKLEERTSQALCNFLNSCQGNVEAHIHCNNGWTIILQEKKLFLDIHLNDNGVSLLTPLSHINNVVLMVKGKSKSRSLDDLNEDLKNLWVHEEFRGFQELPKELVW